MAFEGPKRRKPAKKKEQASAASPEKKAAEEQARLKKERAMKAAVVEHLFRYGYLDPAHPIQTYVDALADVLRPKAKKPFRVIVSPDWNEVNALASSDAIVLGRRMLLAAKTEPALLGILAHELQHIESDHVYKSDNKGRITPMDFVASLGQERVHEYEADLKGTVKRLDEAGINPMGYKTLLHEFHGRAAGSGHDIAHGSSLDRALNIDLVAHTIDLASIDEPLAQIPPEIVASAKDIQGSIHSNIHIALQPKRYFEDMPIEEKHRLRAVSISQLNERELPLALGAVASYMQVKPHAPDHDPDDIIAYETIFSKIEDKIGGSVSDTARPLAAYLCAHLAGYNDKSLPKTTPGVSARLSFGRAEVDEIFAKLSDAFAASGAGYMRQGLQAELPKILALVFEKKTFHRPEDKVFRMKEFLASVRAWAPSLVQLDEAYGTQQQVRHQMTAKDIERIAGRFLAERFPTQVGKIEQAFGVKAGDFAQKSAKRGEYKLDGLPRSPELESYIAGFDQSFADIRSGDREAMAPFVDKGKALLDQIGWQHYPQLMYALTAVIDLHAADESKIKTYRDSIRGEETMDQETYQSIFADAPVDVNIYGDPRVDAMIASLLIRILEGHPWYKKLSAVRKEAVRFAFMDQYGALGIFQEYKTIAAIQEGEELTWEDACRQFDDHYSSYDILLPTANAMLEGGGFSIGNMDNVVKQPATASFLLHGLKDFSNWSEELGGKMPQKTAGLVDHYTKGRGVELCAEALSRTLASRSLDQQLTFLRKTEQGGLELNQHMAMRKKIGPILLAALLDTCESGAIPPMVDILYVAAFLPNPFLHNTVERYATAQHWPQLSFAEKLDLIFGAEASKPLRDAHIAQDFIEEIHTREEYLAVKSRFESSLEELSESGSIAAAVGGFVSNAELYSVDANELMEALLTTAKGDGALVQALENHIAIKGEVNVHGLVQQLYCMDDLGRQVLLRSLLTKDKGLLQVPYRRKKFFDFLFDTWVKQSADERDLMGVLKQVKTALVDTKDWPLLYFALQSTLRDRIAIPPEKVAQVWDDEDDEDDGTVGASEKKVHVEERARLFMQQQGITQELPSGEMTPVDFTKQFVSRTGAPGVRFLQLLPQFVELTPAYEAKFADVYDGVKGQSKFAAMMLLEREWPEFWDEIPEFGDRVGGGSIMSVFRAENKDGRQEVLKVRNPNISHHLQETFRFANQILESLERRHGGAYVSARQTLADIREWIDSDVKFEGFLSQDAEFLQTWDGFKPEGHDYGIKVPHSYAPASAYFIREEFIEGKNLTKWDELIAAGHDMKQVISVLTKMYVGEVMEGKVHSDVHIGNFAVTPDKQVAVFDRNFFLNFDESERLLIGALLNPIVEESVSANALRDYLDPNGKLNDEARTSIALFAGHMQRQEWSGLSKALVDMKRHGVRMPLKLTLLLKNFNSLQQMARKAGFAGLSEAYLHQVG